MSTTRSRVGLLLSAGVLAMTAALAGCGGGDSSGSEAAAEREPSSKVSNEITEFAEDPGVKELVALNEKATTFVGKVDGTDGYIALVDNGAGVITAYLCDGKTIGAWASGTLSGDALAATGPSGLRVDATISGSTASGQVVLPNGESHGFTASEATAPAGLYQPVPGTRDDDLKIGWVVLSDGSQRGLALTSQKKIEIVKPVDTAAGTGAGGPAGPSTGPVTTAAELTTECATLQRIWDRGFSTAASNPPGSSLHQKGLDTMGQANGYWVAAGCPPDISATH